MSITNRLRIGLGLIIFFLVVLTITGIRSLTMMNADMGRIMQDNYRKIAGAQTMRNAIADIDDHMYNVALATTLK